MKIFKILLHLVLIYSVLSQTSPPSLQNLQCALGYIKTNDGYCVLIQSPSIIPSTSNSNFAVYPNPCTVFDSTGKCFASDSVNPQGAVSTTTNVGYSSNVGSSNVAATWANVANTAQSNLQTVSNTQSGQSQGTTRFIPVVASQPTSSSSTTTTQTVTSTTPTPSTPAVISSLTSNSPSQTGSSSIQTIGQTTQSSNTSPTVPLSVQSSNYGVSSVVVPPPSSELNIQLIQALFNNQNIKTSSTNGANSASTTTSSATTSGQNSGSTILSTQAYSTNTANSATTTANTATATNTVNSAASSASANTPTTTTSTANTATASNAASQTSNIPFIVTSSNSTASSIYNSASSGSTSPGYCSKFNSTTQQCIECAIRSRVNPKYNKTDPSNPFCLGTDQNCKNYTLDGSCLICYDGYALANGKCVNFVPNYDRHCKTFALDNTCALCYSGFYVDSSLKNCQIANPLCKTLVSPFINLCDSCYGSYILSNGQCIVKTSNSPIISNNVSPNPSSIYYYQGIPFVTSSSPNPTTTSTSTSNTISDALCSVFSNGICTQCNSYAYFKNGVCTAVSDFCRIFDKSSGACTSCYVGYQLTADGTCILSSRDDNCKVPDNVGGCKECYLGYGVRGGVCQILQTLQ